MIDSNEIHSGERAELKLAREQALKYGKDLAQIYVAERARREELEIAYQALSAVFASTPDSLIVLNEEHLIQQANLAFSQLVEMPTDELIGQPIGAVLHSYELLHSLNRLIIDSHAPTQIEITIAEPAKRSLAANIARLSAGGSSGWIIVLHDQTRLKRMENQKAEFINIASHELRTPLTALLGYGHVLHGDLSQPDVVVTEEHRIYLDAILRGATRLKRVVDELVQFAKLNGGEVQPTGIIKFKLRDLINDLIAEFRAQAERQQVTIRVDVDDSLTLQADESLLRMALSQLLSNAIMFNRPGGSVQIEAALIKDQVQISIRDSGIGIPHTELKTIFEPFFQVEDHDTRRTDGLGMGLPLARRAIELLDGKIAVDSRLGMGTTFTLTVPLLPSPQQVEVNQPAIQQPNQPVPPTPEAEALRVQLETSQKQSLVYARDMMKLYRELQQTNRELKGLNVQLDEANKLKSNFLGAISHELRSPFASIDFALQALTRHGTERWKAEQRELLADLTRSSAGARRLIDNLIAYAGLLSKQGRLDLEVVHVGDLLDEVTSTLAPMAKSRGLHLETQYPRGLTLPAADRKRLSEAVWHLLHNAIKFTKAGGQIVVHAREEEGTVFIAVKDTGVGIPPEQQTIIWESFAQLSDALRRGVEGLGLGLALVRYVAAAHGGNVVLHSTPGVGSVIGFWLPLSAINEEAEPYGA